jgi:hypothetical protein
VPAPVFAAPARPEPSFEIQARLDLLESAVRAAPSLDGITLADALALLARELGQRISPETLRYTLSRWEPRHSLTVRAKRVRLASSVIAEILAHRHLVARAQRMSEEPVLVEADDV